MLDDGGDATLLIHLGCDAEKDLKSFDKLTNSEEEVVLANSIRTTLKSQPHFYSRIANSIIGIDKTTTGVKLPDQVCAEGTLLFPAYNVNDCVTKSSSTTCTAAAKA